ncbi:DNA replication complex GINS protein PSF3 [Leucoagaricus sp. SymC.cos]|nr:DNA replication complex GINS protein PSF3 [Leucoagaricus sp. SymC.cos]
MYSDYFSVDAILAENQKIQCAFKQKVPEMGHLGGGTDRDAHGAKIQIPVWLAYTVLYSQWADFNIPTPFNQRVRNALRAEACSVRLSNLVGAGSTWYGFGKTIIDLLDDEQAAELSRVLSSVGLFPSHRSPTKSCLQTFRSRLPEIIDQAHHFATLSSASGSGHKANDSAQLFREGLDVTEREIFALAQESVKRMKRWHEEGDASRH